MLFNKIDGYKKVHKLTPEEYDMFKTLYMEYDIFANPHDPLGLESDSYETFAEIAKLEMKPKLDQFVKSLHTKYKTDGNIHGIYKGYIVIK